MIAELGRGSTSIVYLGAVDGPSGYSKLFALKLLRPALAVDPAMVALFLMEARIGAQLNHPNVVSTLEIEEHDTQPFIVMEYLDGKPLQEVITSARIAFTPLPIHMHLAVLSGALEGLAHAHAALGPGNEPLGIVHRDVSPHNVFVTISGTAKLLDFGFAQTAHSPNTMLTSAARVAYMSPEQSTGALVDARSDLFSIGVMMWEAVTRRRFWSEEATKADILRALRSGEFPPNRESALARSSDELRSMVLKATSPDPDDRYTTAAEFQEDLRVALSQVTPATYATRDLGKRVVTLFAGDRARLQSAIEEQAAGTEAPPRRSVPPVARSQPPEERVKARAASTPAEAPARRTLAPPAAVQAEHSAPVPVPSAPAVETKPAWRVSPPVIAAAGLGVLIVVMLTIAALHSNPGGPAPPASAASMVAPAEKTATGPAVEAAEPTVDTTQPGAPVEAPVATATTEATRPAPPSRSASGTANPRIRPPAPAPSIDRVRASDSVDQVPIQVIETRPAIARPPRPIDSSNPYGP